LTPGRPSRRLVLALAGLSVARPALAEAPVALRLLVGAPRGGGADRWARSFAPFLERHWPRSTVTLANQPGEGGLVAARALADTPANGRTIGLLSFPGLLARAVERSGTEVLDRLDFVAVVTDEPVVLVAPPGADLAQLRARPGKLLGCPPPGSAGQLMADDLSGPLGLSPLSFPNAATARQAVLAGNLAAALLLLPDVLTALREDRLAAIAIGGAERSPLLPDVPRFEELGLARPLSTWRGCVLPRDVPAAMREKLERSLQAVVADPEFVAQGNETGFRPRFIPSARWVPALDALRTSLAARWQRAPWIARPD